MCLEGHFPQMKASEQVIETCTIRSSPVDGQRQNVKDNRGDGKVTGRDGNRKEEERRERIREALKVGPMALPAVSEDRQEEQRRRRLERLMLADMVAAGGIRGRDWIEASCRGLSADTGRLRGRVQSLIKAESKLSSAIEVLARTIEEASEKVEPAKVMLVLKEVTRAAQQRRAGLRRDGRLIAAAETLARSVRTRGRDREGIRRAVEIATLIRVVLESSPDRQREATSYDAVTKQIGGGQLDGWPSRGIAEVRMLTAMAGSALMTRAEAGAVSPDLRRVVQALEGGAKGRMTLATYSKAIDCTAPEMAQWIRTGEYPEEEQPTVEANRRLEKEDQTLATEALAGLMVREEERVAADEVRRAGRSANLVVVDAKGDVAKYDTRRHKPASGRMLAGQPCKVIRAGVERRSTGEEPERVLKAIVERI